MDLAIGCSGARLATTLIHEMARTGASRGIASLAGASSRNEEETRRTSAARFADDHLEGWQSARNSGVRKDAAEQVIAEDAAFAAGMEEKSREFDEAGAELYSKA